LEEEGKLWNPKFGVISKLVEMGPIFDKLKKLVREKSESTLI
jgi:hypothetical protein